MASSYNYSTSSSEVGTPYTPRSSSPTYSVASRSSSTTISKRISISTSRRNTAMNPIGGIDIAAIEAAMKQSSLDHLKGYSQTNYPTVTQSNDTEYISQESAQGYQVLREPAWNKGTFSSSLSLAFPTLQISDSQKGTSFTPEDRVNKNLTGLIPHVLESLETQCIRAMRMINSRTTPIDKYLYLSNIKAQNTDLFYRLLIDNIATLMPLVYTPTIGDVCLQYSTLYTRPEALYISIKQRKSMTTILRNWPYPNPSICVVTDGSRILGLGDLGVNGVGISVRSLPPFPLKE